MHREKIVVLGATGSIGLSTLDVLSRHPERFEVVALTGFQRIELLAELCLKFRPKIAVAGSAEGAELLSSLLAGQGIEVRCGEEALLAVAALPDVDTVMAAIVGAAGLRPTLAAVQAGKRILLANKEALVMAGGLFMAEVAQSGAKLLPIDSEHNAIFQSLPAGFPRNLSEAGVRRILLTASGGPFRTTVLSDLAQVTPEQACAHPNWSMGRKISVDSATMMNKGLEVIEARWLFNLAPELIDVVVHPQSVVHSLVQYIDGSVIAELGNPDMRTPIAHALGFPERIESGVPSLDLFEIAQLTFERPDLQRFPCLRLAYDALHMGNGAPAVLNAANEIAVDAFLNQKLAFLQIPSIIEAVLTELASNVATTLEQVFALDTSARLLALQKIGSLN